MDIIADIFLAAGAIGAGIYCFVLGRRLNRFNDLEKGVGGAVAVLSAQVDDLTKTLSAAQTSASGSAKTLTELVHRAEDSSRSLELKMASLHDLPKPQSVMSESERPKPDAVTTPDRPSEPMFTRRRTENGAV